MGPEIHGQHQTLRNFFTESQQPRQAWAFQLGHIGVNLVLVARQGGVRFPRIQGFTRHDMTLDARREKPLEDVKEAILKVKPDIEVQLTAGHLKKILALFFFRMLAECRSNLIGDQVDVFHQDLSQLNASRFSEMLEGRDVTTLAGLVHGRIEVEKRGQSKLIAFFHESQPVG